MSDINMRVLYAAEDAFWLNVFEGSLNGLQQDGVIAGWECSDVSTRSVRSAEGRNDGWYREGDELVCVLISQHFFASEFSDGLEMEQLLERHEDGELVLVPILLHDIDWRRTSFSLLRMLGEQAPYAVRWSSALHDFVALPEAIQRATELYSAHTKPAITTAPDFASAQQMVRKLLLANCQQEMAEKERERPDTIQPSAQGDEAASAMK
ncbi:hypothetical protein KDH_77770 [Dictyobacter sp. S3.2.2.5]|uniref:TIR domain-containing protein n=1 Tax=Dictyobacter halimunensis TaxID=3026934 RepID=A0ABQ6G7Y8_9CHLR|nr:hypothetical protein KDH_77770 [Dictyobacter sp. S3.2.2.5]